VLKLRLKLTLKIMNKESGHSLFRAFSHQLFGTPDNHMYLRRRCVAYLTEHFQYFQQFVDITFEHVCYVYYSSHCQYDTVPHRYVCI
jgi:hypothetical protein